MLSLLLNWLGTKLAFHPIVYHTNVYGILTFKVFYYTHELDYSFLSGLTFATGLECTGLPRVSWYRALKQSWRSGQNGNSNIYFTTASKMEGFGIISGIQQHARQQIHNTHKQTDKLTWTFRQPSEVYFDFITNYTLWLGEPRDVFMCLWMQCSGMLGKGFYFQTLLEF